MKIFNLKQDKKEIKEFYSNLKQFFVRVLNSNPTLRTGLNTAIIVVKWLTILLVTFVFIMFASRAWANFQIFWHSEGLNEIETQINELFSVYKKSYSFLPPPLIDFYNFYKYCDPINEPYVGRPQRYNQSLKQYLEEIENYRDKLTKRTTIFKERELAIDKENLEQPEIKKQLTDKLLVILNTYNTRLKEYKKYFSDRRYGIGADSFSQVKEKCTILEIQRFIEYSQDEVNNLNERINKQIQYYNSL